MKVAVVHDWLVTYGGAERALEQILMCYPDADLYCVVKAPGTGSMPFLKNRKIVSSFIQSLPFAVKWYRFYLPLMPIAVEQFDLSNYDLIISSCHAVSKGVLSSPEQVHVSYTYSPPRYAWDLQHQYVKEQKSTIFGKLLSPFMAYFLHKFRLWDIRTSNSVDHFIVISKFIGKRVQKLYRRRSVVIYPPVNTDFFQPVFEKGDYYFIVSRMVPYKKVPMIVEAFNSMPDKKLVVIGDGPDFRKCQLVAGSNVNLLGFQSQDVVLSYLQHAKAFIFMAIEDFGIAPLEAQSCGTPVIAYAGGALPETVVNLGEIKATGVLFDSQSIGGLVGAIDKFENSYRAIDARNCVENASNFSEQIFRSEFTRNIDMIWERFVDKKRRL